VAHFALFGAVHIKDTVLLTYSIDVHFSQFPYLHYCNLQTYFFLLFFYNGQSIYFRSQGEQSENELKYFLQIFDYYLN
jgi:hypothetical protein